MRTKFFFSTLLVLCAGLSDISAQEKGEPVVGAARTISGGVLNGKAISLPKPAYPAAAKAVRASGAVNVQITIDEAGNVISAAAVSGHPLLRAAAASAARQARFSPTTLEGKAVKVTGVIVYNFSLPNEVTQSNPYLQLIPMGLAMFLTALKEIPLDAETDQIMRGLSNELPAEMKAEKKQFDKLAGARSAAEKGKIIDEIIASVRNNLRGTDAWMIDFGKQWGSAIGEAFKIADSNNRKDRQNFIAALQGMNRLLESPPKDISGDVVEKIRVICSYDDESDAISPEFISDFFTASLDFVQYMIEKGKSGKS